MVSISSSRRSSTYQDFRGWQLNFQLSYEQLWPSLWTFFNQFRLPRLARRCFLIDRPSKIVRAQKLKHDLHKTWTQSAFLCLFPLFLLILSAGIGIVNMTRGKFFCVSPEQNHMPRKRIERARSSPGLLSVWESSWCTENCCAFLCCLGPRASVLSLLNICYFAASGFYGGQKYIKF